MKKIIVLLMLGCSAFLQAQNKVTGTVTDVANQPLQNVTIYISELHNGTTTDENGKYTLYNVPKKAINISFSYMGFTTQNKNITITKPETVLDILLEPTVFEMDAVIVSTGFNKLQSQNVMKVAHESVKNFEKRGAVTLIEGLATIPGVSQVSTGASIGKPVIRGLSGNRVLVYSQGVRIENQQFGDEHGLGLNDAGVESVEVIKGPASLLYGSDAIGGVLYFNPEKFANANSFSGDFSQKIFSNTLGSNTTLGLKTSTENWKFLLRGAYNTHSDYRTGEDERVTNTRFNEADLKAAVGYHNTAFSTVLRYNYNNLDLGIPEEGIDEQTKSKQTIFPKQGVANHLLSWNSILFFKDSKMDIDLGYIANNRSEYEDSAIPILNMKLKTFNYNAKYYLPTFGKFETVVGVQGMHQTNANFGEEYLIPNATTNDFGIFGTFNYSWGANVVQAGLRFDNRNIVADAYGIPGEEGSFEALQKKYDSFNAALGYKTDLAKNLALRINFASGFRAPNLAELTSNGVHEGTNRYEIGNSALQTEQNVQADLNLEYKTEHFEFFANGFYNHINNYIYTAPTGEIKDENAVFEYVQDNANLYGGEIGLHFHPHPLDWLHYETSFETVTGKKSNGEYLPLVPANNWNNTIRTEFDINKWFQNGYATLNVSSTFSQKNTSEFETNTAGYTLLNLGFGGKVSIGKTVFNLNLNVNNLLNKSYIAHLSRLKTDGISNIGRNIIFGLNFNF